MTSILLPCPICGEEVEISLAFEPPEWDTNVSGGWIAEDFTRSCDCATSDAEDDALATEAEKRANADDAFGVTVAEMDYEPW